MNARDYAEYIGRKNCEAVLGLGWENFHRNLAPSLGLSALRIPGCRAVLYRRKEAVEALERYAVVRLAKVAPPPVPTREQRRLAEESLLLSVLKDRR